MSSAEQPETQTTFGDIRAAIERGDPIPQGWHLVPGAADYVADRLLHLPSPPRDRLAFRAGWLSAGAPILGPDAACLLDRFFAQPDGLFTGMVQHRGVWLGVFQYDAEASARWMARWLVSELSHEHDALWKPIMPTNDRPRRALNKLGVRFDGWRRDPRELTFALQLIEQERERLSGWTSEEGHRAAQLLALIARLGALAEAAPPLDPHAIASLIRDHLDLCDQAGVTLPLPARFTEQRYSAYHVVRAAKVPDWMQAATPSGEAHRVAAIRLDAHARYRAEEEAPSPLW